MKNTLLSLALILFGAAICSAQTTLYFPHFVDGSLDPSSLTGFISAMAITNPAAPGTAVASGSLTLKADNGSPLNVTLYDQFGNAIPNSFQLAGGQTRFFLSPQSASNAFLPFSSGFVTITSNLPVTGGLVFLEANQLGTFATAGVPATTALTKQGSIVVVTTNSNPNRADNTGLAIANPGSSTATITFQLLNPSGNLIVPQVTRTVNAGNHTAFFVNQLFPNAPPNIFGTLRINSDLAVASTALFFEGPAFGTLPIYPLP